MLESNDERRAAVTNKRRRWRQLARASKKAIRPIEISALLLSTAFAAYSAYLSYESLALSRNSTLTVSLGPVPYYARENFVEIGEYAPLEPFRTEVVYVHGLLTSDCSSFSIGSLGSLQADAYIDRVRNGTTTVIGVGCITNFPGVNFPINFGDIITTRLGSTFGVGVLCPRSDCNLNATLTATVVLYR